MTKKRIDAPYWHYTQIREQADSLRVACCQVSIYPVDVFEIAEFCLGLDFQPQRGLKNRFDIDAVLLSDFKTILIDNDEFTDKASEPRLRFSIAHEIGHLILHRQHLLTLYVLPKNANDLFRFSSLISETEYRKYEYQANEFGGRLLVPVDMLVQRIIAYCSSLGVSRFTHSADDPEFLEALFANMAKEFGVSSDVIVRRVKYEKLNLENIIWNSLNGIRVV
jgi:Zn-dependent peptidase ImmA (M78 family)